jgi:hypothetical protein
MTVKDIIAVAIVFINTAPLMFVLVNIDYSVYD